MAIIFIYKIIIDKFFGACYSSKLYNNYWNNIMKIIMLTDHSSHTEYDSVYALPKAISKYSNNITVYAASRAINAEHFLCKTPFIDCCIVDDGFCFENREQYFNIKNTTKIQLSDFDVIFFRIDRPISDKYLKYCRKIASKSRYINTPEGLIRTGSKEFLVNFRDICPDFTIVKNLKEIEKLVDKYPIVLKPLGGYGGYGIIKIISFEEIYIGKDCIKGNKAKKYLHDLPITYYPIMAMKYLKKVSQGDKRILVVAGECLGAILRIPKQNSWLCNLAQGATSAPSQLTKEEHYIVKRVDSVLNKEGINVYGIDTLVDDNGKRIMSEINTTNVGGFIQLQQTSDIDIMYKIVDLLFKRIMEV